MSTLTLRFKGKVLRVIHLTRGKMFIGSEPSCDIHIDNLAINPRHAIVTSNGSESILHKTSSEAELFVNDIAVENHSLVDEDLIRMGKYTLSYSHHPSENEFDGDDMALSLEAIAEKNRPKKAWLQIMSGANLGQTISLNKNMTNLGKPGVQTAVVVKRSGGYFFSNLEGQLTAMVNSRNINNESVQLHTGDIIQIGNIKLSFYLH